MTTLVLATLIEPGEMPPPPENSPWVGGLIVLESPLTFLCSPKKEVKQFHLCRVGGSTGGIGRAKSPQNFSIYLEAVGNF